VSRSEQAERAGRRAVKNTAVVAVGEIVGKLASLALFAVLARQVGESQLGVFVLAFAFLQIVMVPIDLGLDRYLLRQVARDRARLPHLFGNVLVLKLVLAIPVFAIAVGVLFALGYSEETRETVYVLAGGLLLDSLAATASSAFTAFERNELRALTSLVQRASGAVLGIGILAAGGGVVSVAAAYTVGSLIGFLVGLWLVHRHLPPAFTLDRARWRALTQESVPFAAQDVFTILLFRVDAVLLSLLSTDAAVGRYGAAYRLLESTLFVSYSLAGAFAAMYTYLEDDSDPTIQAIFGRSIKLALAALVPAAVVFGILAEPIVKLVYGAELAGAADPLELLAPVVVLLGFVVLCTSLVVSRRNATIMVPVTAAMCVLNIALNFALIPSLDDSGAAAAMLITEAAFAAIVLVIVLRTVRNVAWLRAVAAVVVAGAAMAVPAALLHSSLLPALVVSSAVYLVVLVAVERVVSPTDLRFAVDLVRGRRPQTQ
jgi:O-antigen/teichoic acid export membrane protein